jgi:magnesium chelatase family protein
MIKLFTLNQLKTVAVIGIEAIEVNVQIEIVKSLPSFVIVGMANRAITESKERIRGVFNSLNIPFPNGKIIVNLCPADILKEGSHYDLPIIIGLLQASKIIKYSYPDTIFFGELSLNGEILKTKDILSAALYCYNNDKRIIVHENYYHEMTEIFQEKSHLIDVANNLWDIIHNNFKKIDAIELKHNNIMENYGFNNIMGNSIAKKAAALSLIGRHNILFFGPPGCGKSLMAKTMGEFKLPLSHQDKLTVSSIYGKCGLLEENTLINTEPFRNPHHSISYVGLLGGGSNFKPGEISLAHKGSLFLDELTEFSPQILDMLRQSLEDKKIIISRAQYNITMPCDFQLIAAMNPCKCGYYGTSKCHCNPANVEKYQKKISGPLLDRIDMKIFINGEDNNGLDGVDYHNMVLTGRQFNQRSMGNNAIKNHDIPLINVGSDVVAILDEFCQKNYISFRKKLKILGVARTIADTELSPEIQLNHLLESIFFTVKMSFDHKCL